MAAAASTSSSSTSLYNPLPTPVSPTSLSMETPSLGSNSILPRPKRGAPPVAPAKKDEGKKKKDADAPLNPALCPAVFERLSLFAPLPFEASIPYHPLFERMHPTTHLVLLHFFLTYTFSRLDPIAVFLPVCLPIYLRLHWSFCRRGLVVCWMDGWIWVAGLDVYVLLVLGSPWNTSLVCSRTARHAASLVHGAKR
uniref:Uncharacterized protein n=1 Tax=Mycena chlorophos TaxID=658473 RepID=A0ABQ0M7F6_MYCCL|nr:predicted protein [Mycena chlorophos]